LVPNEAELAEKEGRTYETAEELLVRIKAEKEEDVLKMQSIYDTIDKKRRRDTGKSFRLFLISTCLKLLLL